MPLIAVNGTQLHYQQLGKSGESGNATPVIMIHGLLVGNLTSWYFGAAAALAKSHQVLVYDLRGHGMSDPSADGYTVDHMVSDLEALIRERELPAVSLVGHSYGGLIALNFALRNPNLVRQLVIVEAPLPPSRVVEMDSFFAKNPAELLQALPADLRALMERPGRQSKKFLARIQFLLFETNLLENLKREADISDERLRALHAPTLLIYGKSGQMRDVGLRLERVLPQARLDIIEGGHYLTSDNPAGLAAKLVEFIQ